MMPDPSCPYCPRSARPLWRFRDDDRHCSLCGRKVLHLQVGHRVPDGGEVYLYDQGERGIEVAVATRLGVDPNRPLGRGRPALDLALCSASFNGPGRPQLDFAVVDVTPAADVAPRSILRFKPVRPCPALPASGLPGSLTLATNAGDQCFSARLIARPGPLLSMACADRTNRVIDPATRALRPVTWQVHHAGRAQTLEMVLTSRAPVWVLKAEATAGERNVGLKGFEVETRLDAGQSHRFSVIVDSTGWTPNRPRPFALSVTLANLRKEVLAGSLLLSGGRPLILNGENPKILTIQLGRSQSVRFTMEAAPSVGPVPADWGPIVRIDGIRVTREPDRGEWLRVTQPVADRLPLEVHPRSEATPPADLELLIDTSRLDREEFANKLLIGRASLTDSSLRRHDCEIRVTTERLDGLDSDLAIDWGTTNSCAAYRDSRNLDGPTDVPFSTDEQRAGQFPSELYFIDASNHETPWFEIGPEAVRRGEARPECCLRSLKRKFQTGGKVQVVDERNRIESYPVERLAQHAIHRLVGLAEASLGKEVLRLGLTFPTKWRKATRDRLARVASALREQFAEERRPREVTVHPPQIDEANAVAIALLVSPDFPDGLGATFHVVAYDFGGGTIDTSVLEVSNDEASETLRTRYVGLGGLKDFGGDEVTRATMMLLHERITEAFRDVALSPRGKPKGTRSWVREVPLTDDVGEGHRDGVERYLIGRKNWAKLWEIAEQIKFALCDDDGLASGAIWPNLNSQLSQIQCLVDSCGRDYDQDLGAEVDGPTKTEILNLYDVYNAAGGSKETKIRDRVAFTLDEVYDFELDDIERSNNGRKSTIRERVGETIEEIAWQCADAVPAVEPAIFILAGGGCRLPLVRRLMVDRFPAAKIVHNPISAKSRVAHGMASYLEIKAMAGTRIEPTRSVDVIHHHIGLKSFRMRLGKRPTEEFTAIARAGSPIDDDTTVYPFRFRPKPTGPGGGPQLDLFLQSAKLSTRLGPVALDRPIAGEAVEGCLAVPLPYVEGATYGGSMKIVGERGLRIVVAIEGKSFGPYPIDLPTDTLLEMLQQ